MKRGRHDSEYDKIRQRAGFARPQYEFDEIDPKAMFESERVEAARADFHQRMAELNAREAEQDAARKALADDTSRRGNLIVLVGEYARAGVKPPFVNERGEPTVSLSMLKMQGWEITEFAGQRTLLRPASAGGYARRTREDYERERGEST
jgi:hypothetical protein